MDKVDRGNFLQSLPDWVKAMIGILAIVGVSGSGLQIANSTDHLSSKFAIIEAKIEELIKNKEVDSQKREKMIEEIYELKSDVKELKRHINIDSKSKRGQDE